MKKQTGLYWLALTEMEKPLIEKVLVTTRGNQLEASRVLGINRNTLHTKIKRLGISIVKFKI